MTKRHKYYLFWIKSSRGTDDCVVMEYETAQSKEKLEHDLEQWCSTFGAWNKSETNVSYGYKQLRTETKAVILKRWDKLCKQRAAINAKWQETRAKLMPILTK